MFVFVEAFKRNVDDTRHTLERLRQHALPVLVTDRDACAPHRIAEPAPQISDTRNALTSVTDPDRRQKITLLGHAYLPFRLYFTTPSVP